MPAIGKPKTGLAAKLNGTLKSKGTHEPHWKGPIVDGVTQSMLGGYLACMERFRIKYVEGWSTPWAFNKIIEYGHMWHTCEESFAASGNPIVSNPAASAPWERALLTYCKELCKKYPLQQVEIEHWMNVCRVQFPLYVEFWKKHKDVVDRTPLLQEESFDIPYVLPSGRVVRLRGKWDSVDTIGKGSNKGIWLKENKSKGDIDQEQINRQLSFDLQTGLYLVALQTWKEEQQASIKALPIKGVIYNVVRRPLSGGAGTIKQHKATEGSKCPKCKGAKQVTMKGHKEATKCPKCLGVGRIGGKPEESKESFYGRLRAIIKEDGENFFMRWKSEVSGNDLFTFKRDFLHPVLENLCDDYEWWEHSKRNNISAFDYHERGSLFNHSRRHFRLPFGLWNPLVEAGHTDVDEYLRSGSTVGLVHGNKLFSELE